LKVLLVLHPAKYGQNLGKNTNVISTKFISVKHKS